MQLPLTCSSVPAESKFESSVQETRLKPDNDGASTDAKLSWNWVPESKRARLRELAIKLAKSGIHQEESAIKASKGVN